MKRILHIVLCGLALAVSHPSAAQTTTTKVTLKADSTVCRDAEGRICRSTAAKSAFEKATGHPHGWTGHVVDHIVPLACHGADAPSNMQWQTIADAHAKDLWELDCARARAYAVALTKKKKPATSR